MIGSCVWRGWVGVLSLALAMSLSAAPSTPLPPWSEWLCYRGNGSLDGRAEVKGDFAVAPHVAWSYDVASVESTLIVEPGDGASTVAVPAEPSAAASSEAIDGRWGLNLASANIEGRDRPLVKTPNVIYADLLPDAAGLEKVEFESGFAKPTVNGQWQACVGRCFAWRNGAWEKVWETEPFSMLFQALPVAGDFDGDGKPEVAFLPWYELVILDGATGRVKDRCRFTEGRSYGFFGAYDLDKDGKSEFVVEADFSKHVDVLGFREGKLSVLWQCAIEPYISNPQKILRVNPNPMADVDGDGKQEVVVCAYNDSGDNAWHVLIHDGITGAVKADLANEFFEGAVDVDGDGVAEMLTTQTRGAGVSTSGPIRVYRLKNAAAAVWTQPDGAWARWEPPLLANVNSAATFAQRTVLCRPAASGAMCVFRRTVNAESGDEELRTAQWRENAFATRMQVRGRDLEARSVDASGALLMRCAANPDRAAKLDVASGRARVIGSERKGIPAQTVAIAHAAGTDRPVIVIQGTGEQLVAFHPPEGGTPAKELWRIRGRAQGENWPSVLGPVVADLAGDGGGQILYASTSASGCAEFVAANLVSGAALWRHEFPQLPGTPPVWNTGGIILWQTGHFTGTATQDMLVTVRRSMMHSEETCLLSGREGREIWHRDRQISQRGVGGIPFAVADFHGDGLEDAASFHPSIFYILKGTTGQDIIAMDATWKDVPSKPVYWGLPIALRVGPERRAAVFMAGANMTALVDADGALRWWDALDKSAKRFAFGNFGGSGHIEAMGFGYEDGIRCYNVETGVVEWKMPMPGIGETIGAASGDVNGDGRDEALAVIGRTLYCIGTSAQDAPRGSVLWHVELPANVGPPAIASVDSAGRIGVVLASDDGRVYCVR